MADTGSSAKPEQEVNLPNDFIQIPDAIPGAGYELPNGTRGIFCAGVNGTIDVTLTGGRRNGFPMLTGLLIPGRFKTIHARSATGLNLWAVI